MSRNRGKRPRSIQEIVDVIESSVSSNGEINYRRFCDQWAEAICWCIKNNPALQDFIAEGTLRFSACDYMKKHYPTPNTVEEEDRYYEQANCQVRLHMLRRGARHLRKGAEQGLTVMEQMIIDVMIIDCFDDAEERYVACAKELADVIKERLNEKVRHTKKNMILAIDHIFEKLEELSDKYEVWYDNKSNSLTKGYLGEWFCHKYNGMSF